VDIHCVMPRIMLKVWLQFVESEILHVDLLVRIYLNSFMLT